MNNQKIVQKINFELSQFKRWAWHLLSFYESFFFTVGIRGKGSI